MDDLFQQLVKLQQIVLAFQDRENYTHPFGDDPTHWLNPYWNRTKSGLFLEFYYGVPTQVWTPMGLFKIGNGGGGYWRGVEDHLRQRVEFTTHAEGRQEDIGYIGPVYALHSIDGVQLPTPETMAKPWPDQHEEIKAAWAAFVAEYGVRNLLKPFER